MASDFNILIHRNSDNLHLRLNGDFDDSAVGELLQVIKKNLNGAHRVIIHTNCINTICSFDKGCFNNKLKKIKNDSFRIMFTGENATQIDPR